MKIQVGSGVQVQCVRTIHSNSHSGQMEDIRTIEDTVTDIIIEVDTAYRLVCVVVNGEMHPVEEVTEVIS